MSLVFLFLSMFLNIALVWYLVRLFRKLLGFQKLVDDFAKNLESFSGHLNIVGLMETYGDDVILRNLNSHVNNFKQSCDSFVAFLNEGEQEDDADTEEEEE